MTISAIEVVYPPATIAGWDSAVLPDPPVATWFDATTADDVPETQYAWMLAQGWKPAGDFVDDPINPPLKKINMTRDTFKDKTALTWLLARYDEFFTEKRAQHESIVGLWSDDLLKTQSHLNRMAANHNGYEVLFVNTLDSIVAQVEARANTMLAGAGATFDETQAALSAFATTLTQLGSGYDAYVTQIETILTTQASSLTEFTARTAAMLTQLVTDQTTHDAAVAAFEATNDATLATHVVAYEAKLDSMETAVTTVETQLLALINDAESAYTDYRTAALAILTEMDTQLTTLTTGVATQLNLMDAAVGTHSVTHAGLVALYVSDYGTHAALTRGFLTGLGATELARINEAFDNRLAAGQQELTTRGFYSAALIAQTNTRVERERSEAIAELNDRLNREKLTHEHQLYSEHAGVRDKQVAGEQYLHALDDGAIKYRAEWTLRLHEQTVAFKSTVLGMRNSLRDAQNQFIAQEQGVRESVFGWGQAARSAVLAGKDQVYRLREAVSRWKVDNDFKLAEQLRAVRSASTDIYSQDLGARNAVDLVAADQRQRILTLLNGYIAQYASGVAQYAQMNTANGQFLKTAREQVIKDIMQSRFRYLAGLNEAEADQMMVHRFQIDERNKLAVGLFRFMADHNSDRPDIQEIAQLAMLMGSSRGFTW